MAESLRDVGTRKLQDLLGGDGSLIAQLATMIVDQLISRLGLSNSPTLNTPVMGTESNYQTAINYARQRSEAVAENIRQQNENQRYRQWTVQRAAQATSFDAFKKNIDNKTLTGFTADQRGYNEFIMHKAEGMYNNRALRMMYQQTPAYDEAASTAMRNMAANTLQRNQYVNGLSNRNNLRQTTEFFNNLYSDTGGFDSSNFNGFSEASVNKMGEYLTKNTDVLAGIQTFGDAESIGNSVNSARRRFETKLKDMSSALEPLKDLFGDDIPSMIEALETAADTSLNSLSPEAARDIADRMQRAANSNMFTMDQYSKATQLVQRQLKMMGSDSGLISGGTGVLAERAAAVANSMIIPAGMSKEEAQNFGANAIVKSGAGKGYDKQYNAAYAMWAAKQRAEGKSADIAEFGKLMDAQRAAGVLTPQAAISNIMGRSVGAADLRAYEMTDDFKTAQREGLGQQQNMKAGFTKNNARYKDSVIDDSDGYMEPLMDQFGISEQFDVAEKRQLMNNLDLMYRENNDVMNMDDKAFAQYMTDKGFDLNSQEAKMMQAMHARIRNDTTEGGKEYKASIATVTAVNKKDAETFREKNRQGFARAVQDGKAKNLYELFQKVNDTAGGFREFINTEGAKDTLFKYASTPEEQEEMYTIMDMASKAGLSGTEFDTAVGSMLETMNRAENADNIGMNALLDNMRSNAGQFINNPELAKQYMSAFYTAAGGDKAKMNQYLKNVQEHGGDVMSAMMELGSLANPEDVDDFIKVKSQLMDLSGTEDEDKKMIEAAKGQENVSKDVAAARTRQKYRETLRSYLSNAHKEGGLGSLNWKLNKEGFGVTDDEVKKYDAYIDALVNDEDATIDSNMWTTLENAKSFDPDNAFDIKGMGEFYDKMKKAESPEERKKIAEQWKASMHKDVKTVRSMFGNHAGDTESSNVASGGEGMASMSGLEGILAALMNVLKGLTDLVKGQNAASKVQSNKG